ncbi:TPA: hypothetical protein N0F65_005842, partial [Lagenidium giganteum]
MKKCPRGLAWSDKASGTNVAHASTECSNRGICDYTKGECVCFAGFTGAACQRFRCPNDCSGHGICYSLKTLASYYGTTALPSQAGTGVALAYTNWEKDSMSACFCDYGFQGAEYTIQFTEWKHFGAENNLLSHDGNPPLSSFTCDVGLVATGSSPTCVITDVVATNVIEHEFCSNRGLCDFTSGLCTCYADFKGLDCNQKSFIPDNIDVNDGMLVNPIGLTYNGNVLHLKTTKNTATDFNFMKMETGSAVILTMDGSVRGDGLTTISTGGLSITTGGATIADGQVGANTLSVTNTNAAFTAALVNLDSTRPSQWPNTDFLLINGKANGVTAFTVEASGKTTITNGGLIVNGVGGGRISSADAAAETVLVSATANSFSSDALSIQTASNTVHNLIKATGLGITLFTVANTGRTTVYHSGFEVVAGGATITAGGLYVAAMGETINSGGLVIVNGGETIQLGGLNVADGKTSVQAGGLVVNNGGATITDTTTTNAIITAKAPTAGFTFNFILAQASSVSVFTVRGDGQTTIAAGGLI